jgi:hypothetical protein
MGCLPVVTCSGSCLHLWLCAFVYACQQVCLLNRLRTDCCCVSVPVGLVCTVHFCNKICDKMCDKKEWEKISC